MAVDYSRHGIELWRRSESELAMFFNVELTRAVRYEPRRSEAAERLISMHKRHGEVVTQVLEQKIAEHAAKLAVGSIDDTSMLALVIGKKHLEYQGQVAAEPAEDRPVTSQGVMKSYSSVEQQNAALAKIGELLHSLHAKLGSVPVEPVKKGKTRRKLGKRDTVLFTAILKGLKGVRYCSFLDKYGIRPKWSDSGLPTYTKSYQIGNPWRKKVQDEKTRANLRMSDCVSSELATAINTYLPGEFDEISPLLHSRNSPDASKTSNA